MNTECGLDLIRLLLRSTESRLICPEEYDGQIFPPERMPVSVEWSH